MSVCSLESSCAGRCLLERPIIRIFRTLSGGTTLALSSGVLHLSLIFAGRRYPIVTFVVLVLCAVRIRRQRRRRACEDAAAATRPRRLRGDASRPLLRHFAHDQRQSKPGAVLHRLSIAGRAQTNTSQDRFEFVTQMFDRWFCRW